MSTTTKKIDAETLEILEALREEYDEDAINAWLDNCGEEYIQHAVESFEDAYQGTWEGHSEDLALGAYAEELFAQTGDLETMSQALRYHIDWEGVGRDLRLSGDMTALRTEPGHYALFDNHA